MLSNQMIDLLSSLAILFPAFLIVFTVRGFFKAWAAKLMGDKTPAQDGFLTLNPLAHIDFTGFLIMLVVLFVISVLFIGILPTQFLFMLLIIAGVRWTIPVHIEEGNFKYYKLGVIITTLAGPFGNFLTALFFTYVLVYFPFTLFPSYVFVSFFAILKAIISLAVFFCVLDLIPIPPFDGGRLLQFILPRSWHKVIDWLEEYSIYIFFVLFFLPIVSDIFFKVLFVLSLFVEKGINFLVF